MGSSLKALALKGLSYFSFLTPILPWLNQRINRFPETLASILPLSWEVFSWVAGNIADSYCFVLGISKGQSDVRLHNFSSLCSHRGLQWEHWVRWPPGFSLPASLSLVSSLASQSELLDLAAETCFLLILRVILAWPNLEQRRHTL